MLAAFGGMHSGCRATLLKGWNRPMTRRVALPFVLGAIAIPLLFSCVRAPERQRFPGAPVILISIDTLRADRLPAYGYAKIRTPFLDRFREDAWLFENAYTPCPLTLPAHTTMLTGELPPEHGVRDNSGFVFDGTTHPNLPDLLKQDGYATGAAVSSYVLRYETGLGRLFDAYDDAVGSAPGIESVRYRRPGDKTEVVARNWIAGHAAQPFFYFLHIYEPHRPYDPPEPFRSLYGVTYDAEVATADAIVGTFVDDLKRLGVYDRALIFVVGDHGEGLGDHGEEQHGILLYREAIHVPMLLKLPRSVGAGRTVVAAAQLSDILPTVTAVLGLDTPQGVSGTSLLKVAAKGARERVIYGETLYPRLQLGWSELHSAIDGRYEYIYGPRPELYDMVADPPELHDLIASEASVASRLAAELQRFPRGNEKPSPVDQETLRRLAALGYVGGLHEAAATGPLPNPADNLKYIKRMEEAWRLAAEQRLPEAMAILRAILKENPGMSDAWIKLGELCSDVGLQDEAAAAYRKALGISPVPLPDIAVALGFVELQRHKLDDAESLAKRSLEDVPSKAHELLARVALARGDLATAEAEARAAGASRNPQPSAILVLAEVELRAGRPAEALQVVETAQKCARELQLASVYDLEFLRGDALARLNRVDEAEKAFRAEIAAFPAHSRAYANLAVIRFIRGDRASVDRLIDEMVRAKPAPSTFLLAAETLDSLGLTHDAAAWRRRAASASADPSPR
jgi:arylsulfatase A-like enzyme/Flp pilus assembly protein TadD